MKAARPKIFIHLVRAASFLFFALLFGVPHEAARLPFRALTTSEGLADDHVNRIVRDSRGFLWLCTSEGLSRFDGYEFKNYTQADGLPHRIVNDVIELDGETYLVATHDGLVIFDPYGVSKKQNDPKAAPMFRVFRPPSASDDGKSAAVRDLHRTRDGRVWAATMDGFYLVETADGGVSHFTKIEYELWRSDLRLLEYINILEDRRGGLWLAMPNGLFRYEPDSGRIRLVLLAGVQSLMEDRRGRIWVGSGSGSQYGINIYEFRDGQEAPVPAENLTDKNGLPSNAWINSMLETADGRILVTAADKVCEFVPGARAGEPAFRPVVESIDPVSLGEDGGGGVWIGTETLGALKLARRGFVLYGANEGVPAAEISAIFPGKSGEEIFVSSGTHDILRFDGVKFSALRPFGATGRGWGWNQTDLYSRRTGEWWLATYLGARRYPPLEKFDDLARAEPLKIYTTDDGLHTNEVFRMWEDSAGNVWIYVFGKVGDEETRLHLWERAAGRIRRFGEADGLPHKNNVTAFAEDRSGGVWLGFYAGGIARFRDGRFRYFSVREGFPSGFVNALHTDEAGRVWAATGNSGVVRIDEPTADEPRFAAVTVAEGLSSNRATCLTEDDFGRVYVGTGHGISRIDPESGQIRLYSQADGLPYSAVRVCARDAAGNLWFSQKFSLVRLAPEADEPTTPPPIFVADLRVNGEIVRKLSELGESSVANLELSSEQRQIQIEFFALGFSAGETLRYQFRFDDSAWSEPSAQRTVNLSLAPGSYNFEVRAINSAGTASEHPARVSFSIARPVWQQWWFLLAAAVLVSAVIYLLYLYRLRRLLELEKVRTRIATDLHDDIGASLSEIAILSEVVWHSIAPAAAEQAAITKPLRRIAGTSRAMVDSMSDIVWAINPRKDHLSDLISRMRNLAGEMTGLRDIRLKVTLSGTEDAALALGADVRREVYLIFKETMNNLVKHSGCDTAEIEFRLTGDDFVVTVADDGRGFDAASAGDDGNEGRDGKDETNGNEGNRGGNGLPNMKRRAENLGGSYSIRSEAGRGATAVIRVPVKRGKMSLKNLWR